MTRRRSTRTGRIVDGKLRARVIFLTERPLEQAEATAADQHREAAAAVSRSGDRDAACSRITSSGRSGERIPAAIRSAMFETIGWVRGLRAELHGARRSDGRGELGQGARRDIPTSPHHADAEGGGSVRSASMGACGRISRAP